MNLDMFLAWEIGFPMIFLNKKRLVSLVDEIADSLAKAGVIHEMWARFYLGEVALSFLFPYKRLIRPQHLSELHSGDC